MFFGDKLTSWATANQAARRKMTPFPSISSVSSSDIHSSRNRLLLAEDVILTRVKAKKAIKTSAFVYFFEKNLLTVCFFCHYLTLTMGGLAIWHFLSGQRQNVTCIVSVQIKLNQSYYYIVNNNKNSSVF